MNAKYPRAFLLGITAVFLVLVVLSLIVASGEYFSRDDFQLLSYAQKHDWDWTRSYLPFVRRGFWAYRPLGMDHFIEFALLVFGMNSFAFFSFALFVHFLSGLLVFRIARQLDFSFQIAVFAALLAISRHPSMMVIYYASVFHYVAAIFFVLASLSAFIDSARKDSTLFLFFSFLGLLLALLCNEFAVVLPGLLVIVSLHIDGFEFTRQSCLRTAKRTAPLLALSAFYLYFRFELIAPRATSPTYSAVFEAGHIVGNIKSQLFHYFGNTPTLIAGLGIAAFAAAATARFPEGRDRMRTWLLPILVVCTAWILLSLAPFVVLGVASLRFAQPIEVPMSLFFAAFVEVWWRTMTNRAATMTPAARNFRKRRGEIAIVLLLIVALPYDTLWQRHHSPRGLAAKKFVTAIHEHFPDLAAGSKIIVLYDAPGLATRAEGAKYRRAVVSKSAILRAHYPDMNLSMDMRNLNEPLWRRRCRSCVYLQLEEGGQLSLAEKRYFERPFSEERARARGAVE